MRFNSGFKGLTNSDTIPEFICSKIEEIALRKVLQNSGETENGRHCLHIFKNSYKENGRGQQPNVN